MAFNHKPAEVLQINRQNAAKLVQSAGHQKTLAVLKRAEADLNTRLAVASGVRGPGASSFTVRRLEAVRAQVLDVTQSLTTGLRDVLVSQASAAADLAAEGTIKYMRAANAEFTGIMEMPLALRESLMFERAQVGARSSILNRLASSGDPNLPENLLESGAKPGILQRYGASTIEVFEGILQEGMISEKPWGEVRDQITNASPFLQQAPAYWAERIVRTESIGAYNRSSWESIRSADEDLGDMVKILCMTDDDRTGWDSYQVHGQIRRPEEAFEWEGGLYMSPPNRPNDREVVVPHRIAWPIPEYLTQKTDEEVEMRYKMFRKKGSPGKRPKMTTVPLKNFGKS